MRHAAAVCSILAGAAVYGQVPTATLPGSVVSEDSASIPGASVSYYRAPKYRAVQRDAHRSPSWELVEPRVSGKVGAAADGSFALTALPDGDYLICVDVPAGGYLDPCLWSRGIGFTATLGRATPVAPIVLKKGAILQIRINDPSHLLPPASLISASKLIVGIKAPNGAFYSARLISEDQTGRNMSITVPYAMALKFWIFSRQVKVTEQTGGAVDTAGIETPFTIAPGAVPQTRVFNVTGVM